MIELLLTPVQIDPRISAHVHALGNSHGIVFLCMVTLISLEDIIPYSSKFGQELSLPSQPPN